MNTRDGAQAPQSSQPVAAPQPKAVEDQGAPEGQYDYVNEAVEETMIASDPPALSPQTSIGPPGRAGADKGHRD